MKLTELAKQLKTFAKKRAKKATRAITGFTKTFKANDFVKELNTVAAGKNKEDMANKMKASSILKKYFSPNETAENAFQRSGVAGLMMFQLYKYLKSRSKRPAWLEQTDPLTLKTELKKLYKAAGYNEVDSYNVKLNGNESTENTTDKNTPTKDQWIASILYDKKVLQAIIALHYATDKFELNSTDPSKTETKRTAPKKPLLPIPLSERQQNTNTSKRLGVLLSPNNVPARPKSATLNNHSVRVLPDVQARPKSATLNNQNSGRPLPKPPLKNNTKSSEEKKKSQPNSTTARKTSVSTKSMEELQKDAVNQFDDLAKWIADNNIK